ncbi:manganese catalase family protein [Paramaledivibacter caminithermalis]|jgi:spore coat protein JC|uniref:Spore coat protein JC n=1 Tax=Paramaledivibacter caminithermalis (strain DSM 15212 / CIP 107654 / DViRD3) TaxID=1121301 RepID=A0A1M6T1J8_PARC5|nr:manganese catalase family protein [Paramaledivibacter caminithermalis]SHK50786.1 spore coat protein JC [Paramaledivibacter caminithermalis DSM 15212]
MWIYEKKLQYPVNIKCKDIRMAKYLITQFGGPDGELGAAMRYLSQRYTMPTEKAKALLTDIGTEELAHVEIISTMVYQLLKDTTAEELEEAGLGSQYVQHGRAIYPQDANGIPWTAAYMQSTADPITDLHEDLAAEQKARTTYEHLLNLTDDPGIKDALRFLREREIVHYQRFGEALMDVYELKNSKKYY